MAWFVYLGGLPTALGDHTPTSGPHSRRRSWRHRLLLTQHDLVQPIGDVRVWGGIDAGVDDRLALNPYALPPHGTAYSTGSVVTYLRNRTRSRSRWAVPNRSSSSEPVMASSVVGPEVSCPTLMRLVASLPVVPERSMVS